MKKVLWTLAFCLVWMLSIPAIIFATFVIFVIALYGKVYAKLTWEECCEYMEDSLYPIKEAMVNTIDYVKNN